MSHVQGVECGQQWAQGEGGMLLAAVLEVLPLAVVVAHADGQPWLANSRAVELLGNAVMDGGVSGGNEQGPGRAQLASALRGELGAEEEALEVPGPRGPVAVRARSAPIHDTAGNIILAVVTFEDVSRRRLAEQEVSRTGGELTELSRKLGSSEVAVGLLHNVGNVLSSVLVAASMVRDLSGDLPEGKVRSVADRLDTGTADGTLLAIAPHLAKYTRLLGQRLGEQRGALTREVELLLGHVSHACSIIDRHQAYARAGGGRESVVVAELVEEALSMVWASLEKHGIQAKIAVAELPVVALDRHRVLQILVNLLGNARDALLQGKCPDASLSVSVECDGDRLVFRVADNGVGIPLQRQQSIFDYGFTTKASGNGFGLHSSAFAARELGGDLRCESAGEGQGACFVLSVPLERVDKVAA